MSVIDDIKSRLDIVEVISQVVQLRRSGKSFIGFCPFHPNTRTPAFAVYPDTQTFHCFSCHASGSVFDFVMRQHGLEFRDALELLAERTGIPLKQRDEEEIQQDQQRTRLLEITTIAARYFNYVLLQYKQGQPGRDYLERRGITTETIEAFQLGYSLHEWEHLLTYLIERKGFAPEEIQAAGLAIHREQGGWYDRFRGRLMFPIRNHKGEVVGFGGRAIGDEMPKYLNTPQTVLFDKSHILYGLDLAREAIRTNDSCVVVEGYMDVLTAHQYGFHNVVAPLGTALTEGHVALIKKLTHRVYLALDADSAGQKATLRGMTTLQKPTSNGQGDSQPVVTAHGLVRWESDVTLHIIRMPNGCDPDDVIKANPQHWRELVAAAVPVVDFYFESYTDGLDLEKPSDQQQALDRLLPILAQLEGSQQRVYIAQLERLVGIRAELILDMIRGSPPQSSAHAMQQPIYQHKHLVPEEHQPAIRHDFSADPYLIALDYRVPYPVSHEDYLMALVLRYPSTRSIVEETIVHYLDNFPRVEELLGSDIKQLLEQTENRMIWQAWQQAGEPALPFIRYDQLMRYDQRDVSWVQEFDDLLQSQIENLARLKLPRPSEYRYRQEAEKCAKHLRIKQVRRWQYRLSHQANDIQDEQELARIVAALDEFGHYFAFLNIPPHNKSFFDVRHVVEREW